MCREIVRGGEKSGSLEEDRWTSFLHSIRVYLCRNTENTLVDEFK